MKVSNFINIAKPYFGAVYKNDSAVFVNGEKSLKENFNEDERSILVQDSNIEGELYSEYGYVTIRGASEVTGDVKTGISNINVINASIKGNLNSDSGEIVGNGADIFGDIQTKGEIMLTDSIVYGKVTVNMDKFFITNSNVDVFEVDATGEEAIDKQAKTIELMIYENGKYTVEIPQSSIKKSNDGSFSRDYGNYQIIAVEEGKQTLIFTPDGKIFKNGKNVKEGEKPQKYINYKNMQELPPIVKTPYYNSLKDYSESNRERSLTVRIPLSLKVSKKIICKGNVFLEFHPNYPFTPEIVGAVNAEALNKKFKNS